MKNIWLQFRRLFLWLMWKGTLYITFFVGCIYTIRILRNYENDTTSVTNAAFAITAALASLCFGCARSLDNDDKDRGEFTYAGERFLHASIILIIASLLKYAVLSVYSLKSDQADILLIKIATTTIGICVGPLFLHAVIHAHTGMKICSELLWRRVHKHPEWDKII